MYYEGGSRGVKSCYNEAMPKFAFNKLIRDKIADQQIAAGSKPKYRLLEKNEHIRELIAKIKEEAGEISPYHPEEAAAEIADVQQALDDLKELMGVANEQVASEQERKNQKAGPFKKGVYEEYVEVAEDDEWVRYYRKNPDRYPEID